MQSVFTLAKQNNSIDLLSESVMPNFPVEEDSFDAFQRTLAQEVCLAGITVHSGELAEVHIAPAPGNTGIVFIIDQNETVPANIDFLIEHEAGLCTVVGNCNQQVSTIEHLMAAFACCGIDNALIRLEGKEVPIMDGSAEPFVSAFIAAGFSQQKAKRNFLRITKSFSYETKDGNWIKFDPLHADEEVGTLSVSINFDGVIDLIGKQSCTVPMRPLNLRNELIDSRTFGLETERQFYQNRGKGLGASEDNAVLFSHDKVLNSTGLRYADEPVRHKALDMMGDMYLAGWPLLGHISGFKPSHRINACALKALLKSDSYFLESF